MQVHGKVQFNRKNKHKGTTSIVRKHGPRKKTETDIKNTKSNTNIYEMHITIR